MKNLTDKEYQEKKKARKLVDIKKISWRKRF